MFSEILLAKKYFGAKFGHGENIKDGIYAIPIQTSKGPAFMKMEVLNGNPSGKDNFSLFWDESLTVSWYNENKPTKIEKSDFSKLFRKLIKADL